MNPCCSFLFGLTAFFLTSSAGFAMPQTIDDKASVPILTPSLEGRAVKKLRLDNELEVYLVHEPKAKQSAAALAVNVGSFSDPKSYPGMAHFLEHMLFLGSEKYPEESEYKNFIGQHGGSSNAFTTLSSTCYMFSIDNDAFAGALDRFAQFFIAPTFNASATDRERTAVDQEYKRYVEKDGWRSQFVKYHMANPNHPLSHYHMGNLETLQAISRQDLIQWYKKHYSANIMHLVVYSPLPLEELTELVERDFSAVPNHHVSVPKIREPLFQPSATPSLVALSPIKESRTLSLSWEIPVDWVNHEAKSHSIVGHLLGDEGEGSLLASLRADQLATGLSAGGSKVGHDQALFGINITLTEKGLDQYTAVIARCFEAIQTLSKAPIPNYIFEEQQAIALQAYQYQSRSDAFSAVTMHARALLDEDLASYPEKTILFHEYRPQEVSSIFSKLTPKNVLITLVAPEKELEIALDEQEPVLKTPFAKRSVKDEQVALWSDIPPTNHIALPPPNPFIAKDLQLVQVEKEVEDSLYPKPKRILDNQESRAYACVDSYYRTPQVAWFFEVKTPAIRSGSARSEVLRDLYIYALNQSLKDLTYPAMVASLDFHIAPAERNGLLLTISGTSAKAESLLTEIASRLNQLTISSEQLQTYQKELQRRYENEYRVDPVIQAIKQTQEILREDLTPPQEKANQVSQVSLEDFNTFKKSLFTKRFVNSLLYGNQTEHQAEHAVKSFLQIMGGSPYPEGAKDKGRVLQINPRKGPLLVKKKIDLSRNALVLTIQEGAFSFEDRAAQQLLANAVEPAFFHELRTQQQTAYVVWNWPADEEGELAEFFAIESASHEPRDLLARFDAFLEEFLRNLETEYATPEQFETIKLALISQLRTPPENAMGMARLLWTLAFTYDGDFDWMEKRITSVEKLDYPSFVAFAQRAYGRENRRRLAVLLEGKLPRKQSFRYHHAKSSKTMGSFLSREERLKKSSTAISKRQELVQGRQ